MKTLSSTAAVALFITIILQGCASTQRAGEGQVVVQAASPATTDTEVKLPAIDPQILIGKKWVGSIFGKSTGTAISFTFLDLEEGNLIHGTFYIHAPWVKNDPEGYNNRDVPFIGTLNGNRIQIPGLPKFDLVLKGNRIKGKWETGDPNYRGQIDVKKES